MTFDHIVSLFTLLDEGAQAVGASSARAQFRRSPDLEVVEVFIEVFFEQSAPVFVTLRVDHSWQQAIDEDFGEWAKFVCAQMQLKIRAWLERPAH